MLELLTSDRVGPLGLSRGPFVWTGEKSVVESRHLQGHSPRLCRLRTDCFSLYFNSCHGRETGVRPVDRSTDELWIML
jgi:hypothetical protein